MTHINPEHRSTLLFNIISWVLTGLVVTSLLGYTFIKNQTPQSPSAPFTPTRTVEPVGNMPLPSFSNSASKIQAIVRQVSFTTNIPERPRYEVIDHEVVKGDSIFGIAAAYKIKPETMLWANYDILKDNPDSLRIGMDLKIPPTNGVYYQWQEGDTLDTVAAKFKAQKDEIINWPGNNVDLVNPEPTPGSFVMIPGGSREFVQWLIPTVGRGNSGVGNGGSSCGGGPVGSGGFVWPADNHYLSGNDYWPGHLGIDIAAGEGASVYAADSGVVTVATGGWNYGYGNYVMIDHGDGYITLYAHLSQINVVRCQGVYAGNLIGLAGNTGNSFGAHLHFEVRLNGGFINPWFVLP